MAKKKYSVSARADYHRSRMVSSTASENQRYYSQHWLNGFYDPHAENNYRAVNAEIRRKRAYMNRSDVAVYYGYRNGLKAQLEKSKNRRK